MKKESKNIRHLIAFTIAEVIIVVGILGIIAEATIPVLINNANDAQTKAGVKTAYSILSPAIRQAATDNGGTITGICTDLDNLCFKDLIKPYLSYTKDCDSDVINSGCWLADQFMDGTPFGINTGFTPALSAISLKNGMMVLFRWHNKACTYTSGTTTNPKCGWIAVDINGIKGPNRWGKDVFDFHIQDGIVKPAGIPGDAGNYGRCNSTDTGLYSGLGCTSKYLYEN